MKRNEEETIEITFRNFRVTLRHSDRHSDLPRDKPSYRDARTNQNLMSKRFHFLKSCAHDSTICYVGLSFPSVRPFVRLFISPFAVLLVSDTFFGVYK